MSHVPAGVLDLAEAEAALTWPDAPQMPPSLAMPPPLAAHAESHLFTPLHAAGPWSRFANGSPTQIAVPPSPGGAAAEGSGEQQGRLAGATSVTCPRHVP